MKAITSRFSRSLIVLLWLNACATSACDSDWECGSGWQCAGGQCIAPTTDPADLPDEIPLDCTHAYAGTLVINEFLANPQGSDINGDGVVDPFEDEFVELVNLSDQSVNISGVAVQVGSQVRHVFEAMCLGAGQAVVVFGGGDPLPTAAEHTLTAEQPFKLANNGTSIILLGAAGQVLDSLIYDSEATGTNSFARVPDGVGEWSPHPESGKQRKVVHSAGLCSNFAPFPACQIERYDDDPLMDEKPCPLARAGELVINEVLADPGGIDANQDGELVWQHDEFVEMLLLADGARSTKGLTLTVNGKTRIALPDGCVPAGGALLVFGGGKPNISPTRGLSVLVSPKTLILPNAGGVVAVSRNGDIIARFTYGSEGGNDQSMTRFPDGYGAVMLHTDTPNGLSASPGSCTNGMSLPSGCVEM